VMDRNRNSAQPMKNCSMHPMDPIYLFFLLRRVGVVECFNFYFIFSVSTKFLMGFSKCSPSSQGVPQHVPNSTSLYPIYASPKSCLLVDC
jgi:hypothetical protein